MASSQPAAASAAAPAAAAAAAAAPAASAPAASSADVEASLSSYLTEVEAIKKRDEVWTSETQITRLTKPGSAYLNLNPWEVLQLEPGTKSGDLKRQYRKLSFLVHPDKNPNDLERAQQAFDAVGQAYKMVQDEDQMNIINAKLDEAKHLAQVKLEEKRLEAKRKGLKAIPEDNPVVFKEFLRKITIKLFADYEVEKKRDEKRDQLARKREREKEMEEEERKKARNQHQKEWDKGREDRLQSWRAFMGGEGKKKKKKSKAPTLFKPPKPKVEGR